MQDSRTREVVLRAHLADRIRTESVRLAADWLGRLRGFLNLPADDVFPSDQLLDHIPTLILEIAKHMVAEDGDLVSSQNAIVAKAAELGDLRFDQRAAVHQVLQEYDILADVIAEFVASELETAVAEARASDAVRVVARIRWAIRRLQRHTIDRFVERYTTLVEQQTRQLRDFNLLISHEIREPLSVLRVTAGMFEGGDGPDPRQLRDVIGRNVSRLVSLVDKLESLAGLEQQGADNVARQRVEMARVAVDVSASLSSMADSHGVCVRVGDGLPVLAGDPARLELVLRNLLANAIKYSDPEKPDRWVEVRSEESDDDHVSICVADNGIGIPDQQLTTLFERFVRASDRPGGDDHAGLGLGLALVRESMLAMDGRVHLDSRESEGTTVRLSWPCAHRWRDD